MRQARVEAFRDDTLNPPVRGFLHHPASPDPDALVLGHSAGGNCQSPLLRVVAEAFAIRGLAVLRCELPFRQMRPHGPPGPATASRDRAGLRNAVTALKSVMTGRVFLGGHSYGGRQASMLAAEHADVAPVLLLLSYPLHPPRHPAQLRTAHFWNLAVPSLFVSGTCDEFGSVDELTSALKLIPARTQLLAVEGAEHSLGNKLPLVGQRVSTTFLEFIASAS